MTLYDFKGARPKLPDSGDFWVAPGAHVIGDVTLGNGVSIWFGSVLRGDNEPIAIEDGTNIQEQAVIHTDPGYPCRVGENCTVGHKAMLHGCHLGPGTLVGMGATILNGASIGAGCLIGAGALVTEGKVIPDGSLVMGMPGKVIRQLSDEQIEQNLKSAENYRSRMRTFRDNLSALE